VKCEKRSVKDTYKRNLPKRPNHVERDVECSGGVVCVCSGDFVRRVWVRCHMSKCGVEMRKETAAREKRHLKEMYLCEKRVMSVKRDQ